MDALIVGGGIAGPATAMALQRVGIAATVLEARQGPSGEAGSYLTVSPNGLDALDAIGALDLARGIGVPSRRNVMLGASGRRLGTLSLGTPLADGTCALTLKRSLLADALAAEAVRRGIDVRYRARVVSADHRGPGVAVALDDGSELTADVLVGADGVHSRIRGAIDPAAPSGRYVGLTNFGGITRATPLAAALEPECWMFTFGRRAFTGLHRTPAGDVVWFVNVPRQAITPDERARTTAAQWQRWLVDHVADDAGPAADVIAAGHLELAGDNTHDLGHVPVWHRGGMIVIGDAAHAPAPSSGQGASMALEDAVVLAQALRDHDDVGAAFAAYERIRRLRVERIVAAGARSSSAKTHGRVGRAVQDVVMRLVFRYAVTDASTAWMTDHRVDLDAPIAINV